jgi:hypothetical protein
VQICNTQSEILSSQRLVLTVMGFRCFMICDTAYDCLHRIEEYIVETYGDYILQDRCKNLVNHSTRLLIHLQYYISAGAIEPRLLASCCFLLAGLFTSSAVELQADWQLYDLVLLNPCTREKSACRFLECVQYTRPAVKLCCKRLIANKLDEVFGLLEAENIHSSDVSHGRANVTKFIVG